MNIQERGDAMLTAYVNKDFERVKHLWCDRIGNPYEYDTGTIDLHGYSNPSITDVRVSMAVVQSVNMMRDYEAEGREKNEINAAKRKLYSLGYREVFDKVSTVTRYEHIHTGDRPLEKIDLEGEFFSTQDPRKVLESLKK
jgi:hypothetical protein